MTSAKRRKRDENRAPERRLNLLVQGLPVIFVFFNQKTSSIRIETPFYRDAA
jgi:hypothetical protein